MSKILYAHIWAQKLGKYQLNQLYMKGKPKLE